MQRAVTASRAFKFSQKYLRYLAIGNAWGYRHEVGVECYLFTSQRRFTGCDKPSPPSKIGARPSPRRVKPVDDSYADVLEEDDEMSSTTKNLSSDSLLKVPSGESLHRPRVSDEIKDFEDEEEGMRSVSDRGEGLPYGGTHSSEYASEAAGEDSDGASLVERGDGILPNDERIRERQEWLRELPLTQVLDRMLNYLRSTCNEKLVDEEEEDTLFPVVIERFNEFSVNQLLEIVSVMYARSTLLRYGIQLNDMVRDRIALIASTAAKQRRDAGHKTASGLVEDGAEEETESLLVSEEEEKKRLAMSDPVLHDAAAQITPETVLRALLVMGMSARRKRDLPFFHVLGAYFAFYINHYKDSHDLVRVLTAFARAKIIPPKTFLAMLSRRFPVLCKTSHLETLPCYRAMVNFSKMGHSQMNIYRFLSDNMLATIEANITEQKKKIMIAQRLKEMEDSSNQGEIKSVTSAEEIDGLQEANGEKREKLLNAINILGAASIDSTRIKTRFHELVGLKPSMFTKWLFILAKNGAPYQQYLRPFIHPIIIPMLGHFPPPSFTRLLTAISLFKCDDSDLLEPIVEYMSQGNTITGKALNSKGGEEGDEKEEDSVIEKKRDYCPTRADLFVLLLMFSREGFLLPKNVENFFAFCGEVFLESSLVNTSIAKSVRTKRKKRVFKNEEEQFILRPGDMCSIARYVVQLQHRVDIPLESLAPLTELMGHFARRLLALLELRVVSVLQVDDFSDLCRQQHYPDEDGTLEKLMAKRRELAAFVDEDGMTDELDDNALDIDVRETFFKIVLVNDAYRYISYRPLPGSLQVDFREALTKVSAFDMLEAVDLYEHCFPMAIKPPVRLLLSRSFLAKFSTEGEEVISPDGTELVLRPPQEQFVTRKDLERFVALARRSSMTIQKSTDLLKFIEVKARRLGLQELLSTMPEMLMEKDEEARC